MKIILLLILIIIVLLEIILIMKKKSIYNIGEFKQKFTINDSDEIYKALNMPVINGFKIKPLIPIGCVEYLGDNSEYIDKSLNVLSLNDKFIINNTYPLYNNDGEFVVGNDGKGYKIVRKHWSSAIYF